MAAGTALGVALGWPLVRGIFFGGIISVSSTMVILKNLMSRGELASNHGRLLLGMLIVQDLAVVVLILFLPKLAGDINAAAVELLWVLLKALLFIAATLFLGARVVPNFMTRVEQLRSPELFLLTAVMLALGTASVSALLGLSPALGAFMGGLMLTETEFDHRVIAEMIPMRDLFATLFFVSVGMLLDVGFVMRNLPAVLGMALFIMLMKVLATTFALVPFKLGAKTIAFTALGMVSVGEFNYVLALVGRTSGAIPTELYNLILSASLLTIVFTPAAFWVAPRAGKTMLRLPILGRFFTPQAQIASGSEVLENHAIVVDTAASGNAWRAVCDRPVCLLLLSNRICISYMRLAPAVCERFTVMHPTKMFWRRHILQQHALWSWHCRTLARRVRSFTGPATPIRMCSLWRAPNVLKTMSSCARLERLPLWCRKSRAR
jgi:CPA2 family monovalent cation:H+ antiporter-2